MQPTLAQAWLRGGERSRLPALQLQALTQHRVLERSATDYHTFVDQESRLAPKLVENFKLTSDKLTRMRSLISKGFGLALKS